MKCLIRLVSPFLLASLLAACQTTPREDEAAARDESSFITRPSGVGDESAVFHVDSSQRPAQAPSSEPRPGAPQW